MRTRAITRAVAVLGMALAVVGTAQAQLEWRVSVKFILGPNGEMPCCGNYDSFLDITNRVTEANNYLAQNGRGYRFQLAEVTTVPGISQWFNSPRAEKDLLEAAAEASPTTYKWRLNAINVYINNWTGSAVCSFPADEDIVFLGQGSFPTSLFHEIGHYFNLYHTFEGESGDCSTGNAVPGTSDGCFDTLPDHECWTSASQIGQFSHLPEDHPSVTETYRNLMSYRTDARDRLTTCQLDRMADASNGPRFKVATGRTWFVDRNCGAISRDGSSECGPFSGPFAFVIDGVNRAQGGDIVLIRAGNYNAPMTINKSVTLRASRGTVTIGTP